MNYEGLILNPEEMWFLPLENKESPKAIGFSICLRNYEFVHDNEYLEPAMDMILDVLLESGADESQMGFGI
jgi:hypothetical protein